MKRYPDAPVGPQKMVQCLFLLNFDAVYRALRTRHRADIRSLQRILTFFDFAHASVPLRVWASYREPGDADLQLLILFGLYEAAAGAECKLAARSFEFEKPH